MTPCSSCGMALARGRAGGGQRWGSLAAGIGQQGARRGQSCASRARLQQACERGAQQVQSSPETRSLGEMSAGGSQCSCRVRGSAGPSWTGVRRLGQSRLWGLLSEASFWTSGIFLGPSGVSPCSELVPFSLEHAWP